MRWMAVGVLALAACGSGTKTADLPAGQHDLGDGVTVQVHAVQDLPPDTPNVQPGAHGVAVDLEFFNRSDHPIDTAMGGFGVFLNLSDNRQAEGVYYEPMVPKTIAPGRSGRGWEAYSVPDGTTPKSLTVYGEIGDKAAADPVTIDL